MLADRYGYQLSTDSDAARDAYVEGLDRFLAADGEVDTCFNQAIDDDAGFALPYAGLARYYQIKGQKADAVEAINKSLLLCKTISTREASQVNAFRVLIEETPADALQFIREHLEVYPRDALLASTCTTVFGLIGFSGLPGREAEQLAFTTKLAPHYGDDWWFLSQHAFSQVEVGQLAAAEANIERSISIQPRSGQAAHVRSHVYYESGDRQAGYNYLKSWMPDYNRRGLLHGHLAWHLSLWALADGDIDQVWSLLDEDIGPDASEGPPLVILCDTAATLYRASLAGVNIPSQRWQEIARYAAQYFPETGVAFGDVHSAIAYAMAGQSDELVRVVETAKGPAANEVRELATAFGSIAKQDWPEAIRHLSEAMKDHARIGGSRAQRDIIEFTMASVLLRQGKREEARRLLSIRRPISPTNEFVKGL